MKKRELEEEEIFDEDEDDFDSDEYSDIPNIKVDADDFEVKDETLDQIKKRFLEIGKKEKSIQQEDLLEAAAHLDLSDEDIESLIEFFKNKNIKVESDEDEVSNLDDLEFDASKVNEDMSEAFLDDDSDFNMEDEEAASYTDFD